MSKRDSEPIQLSWRGCMPSPWDCENPVKFLPEVFRFDAGISDHSPTFICYCSQILFYDYYLSENCYMWVASWVGSSWGNNYAYTGVKAHTSDFHPQFDRKLALGWPLVISFHFGAWHNRIFITSSRCCMLPDF